MIDDELPSERRTAELLEAGSDIAGSVGAATVGMVVAGPAGAIAGAIGGPVAARALLRGAGELASRLLGRREQVRVGAVIRFAVARLENRVSEGATVRDDGFFADDERSEGEEIIEGILLAAQREHEERKVALLANLLASIALDDSVDAAAANALIRQAEALSFRQLCLLGVFAGGKRHVKPIRRRGAPEIDAELLDLNARGLLGPHGMSTSITARVVAQRGELTNAGRRLVQLMELRSIDTSMLDQVAARVAWTAGIVSEHLSR